MPKLDYRIVIFTACFLSTLANSAIFYAFGTFVLPWMKEFSASGASIGAVTSCGTAVSLFGCAIGSWCVQNWGYRITHCLGGFMLVISFATSSFVNSLMLLFVTYGLIGGLGSSLCMISFVNAVSEHFQNHQPLAFGLVTSSYGIGGLVFPVYFDALISNYTWRGTMLITSAIFGNVIACGLLLHKPRTKSPNISKSLKQDDLLHNNNIVSESLEKFVQKTQDERKHVGNNSVLAHQSSGVSSLSDFPPKKYESFIEITKNVFRSPLFYVWLLHGILIFMGNNIVLTFTSLRASHDLQLNHQQVSAIEMAFGVNSIFRIIFGGVIEYKLVKTATVYLVTIIFSGSMTLLAILANTESWGIFFISCIAAGMASQGLFFALMYDIYGRRKYNVAVGFVAIAQGTGAIVGPMLGGWLFDITGTCVGTFILSGCLQILSSFVLFIGLYFAKKLR